MSDDPILSALARLEAGQALLQAGQADTSDRLVRLEAGQAKLEAGQASFRAEFLGELGKTRGAIMEKVAGLQDAVTMSHADIAVNFGAVDQARLVNDNTRDELRGLNDLVARMMTLILRLQTEVAELKGKPSP